MRKKSSRKIFRHLDANFLMFILLISNRTVFLVQFGINLHLRYPDETLLSRLAYSIALYTAVLQKLGGCIYHIYVVSAVLLSRVSSKYFRG